MGLIGVLQNDPTLFVLIAVSLIFALCVHEFSHGIIAYYYGDDTAFRHGRLTLNPLKHLVHHMKSRFIIRQVFIILILL